MSAGEAVPRHDVSAAGASRGVELDIADVVAGLFATCPQRGKERVHGVVANSRELRPIVDACCRRKQAYEIVDSAVVNKHAVVAVQTCNVVSECIVWHVVVQMQFAPFVAPSVC